MLVAALSLGLPPPPNHTLAELSDSLPQTADAEIDYLAFMNAFEVVDTTHFEGEGRLEA